MPAMAIGSEPADAALTPMRRSIRLLAVWPAAALAAPLGATPLEPGLQGRSDIIFFENFELATWHSNWKLSSVPKNCTLSSAGFKGQALRVAVPQGQHYGTSFGFDFAKFSLAGRAFGI